MYNVRKIDSPHKRKNILNTIEPVREISNNVVCATRKASDQSAHTHLLEILCRGSYITTYLSTTLFAIYDCRGAIYLVLND